MLSLSSLAFDSSVEVVQAGDVVQVRPRGFEDRRVLEPGHAMNRPGLDAEARAGRDDLLVGRLVARAAHLHLGATRHHVPGLVLLVVELEAERAPRLDEEDLADVQTLDIGPDELVPPWLLDLARLEGEGFEAFEVT